MRKSIVAGNWKMNTTPSEGIDLLANIARNIKQNVNTEVIIAAPLVHLNALADSTTSSITIAAQNCSQHLSGAYTGEVSVSMLSDIQINTVIIGHSERRMLFSENNDIIRAKVNTAIEHGMQVILCCGESLEVREAGNHASFVTSQLEENLFQLTPDRLSQVTLAYEPIWAIGTGKTATPDQAQDMHAHIRSEVVKKYGNDIAQSIRILYGGSVKPANAEEIFAKQDVDGGLVGGASLDADSFAAIVEAAHK